MQPRSQRLLSLVAVLKETSPLAPPPLAHSDKRQKALGSRLFKYVHLINVNYVHSQ